jgi:hypothetical protein
VFAPPLELVVVVRVVELLGRVDVAGVDDAGVGVARAFYEVGHGVDTRLARGGVQASLGMTEPVLDVDDDDCGPVGVERRHT